LSDELDVLAEIEERDHAEVVRDRKEAGQRLGERLEARVRVQKLRRGERLQRGEREERQQSGPPERPTATRPLDVLELFGDAIRNAGAVGVVDRAGSGRPVGGRCVCCHS